MAINATIDVSKTPATLTVVSDKRKVSVTVTSNGETASGTATYPISITDSSGKVWRSISDDGVTAVFQ